MKMIRQFPRQVSSQWLHADSPVHPAAYNLSRQEDEPPETTYPASQVASTLIDWLISRANHKPTSLFSPANHLTRDRTHNLRRNHGRLNRLRSIEIWQLHRWDNRPEAVSLLHFSFFPPRNTIHCEPGVATVKKQPFEVKSFRQHEQKEKGLEDWKR